MASAWDLLGLSRDASDVSKPANPSSHKGALIVCIDVEANSYQRKDQPKEVLEVGVAVLDTDDIVGVAPGAGGINGIKRIKARHFMIKDHCHIVNKKYAIGCPDKSLFAVSEYITHAAAKHKIPPCWNVATAPRLSAAGSSVGKSKVAANAASGNAISGTTPQTEPSPYRPVAFVGHDLRSDDSLIRELGITLEVDHLIASYDTQVLSGHQQTRASFVQTQQARLTIAPSIKINIEWDPKILADNKKEYDSWADLRRKNKNAMYAKKKQEKANARFIGPDGAEWDG